jgi:hypothetical protein
MYAGDALVGTAKMEPLAPVTARTSVSCGVSEAGINVDYLAKFNYFLTPFALSRC